VETLCRLDLQHRGVRPGVGTGCISQIARIPPRLACAWGNPVAGLDRGQAVPLPRDRARRHRSQTQWYNHRGLLSSGGAATLAIEPGTCIKRGDQLGLIEGSGVGNSIQVQTVETVRGDRAAHVDVLTTL
jgi:hypothetical protein